MMRNESLHEKVVGAVLDKVGSTDVRPAEWRAITQCFDRCFDAGIDFYAYRDPKGWLVCLDGNELVSRASIDQVLEAVDQHFGLDLR